MRFHGCLAALLLLVPPSGARAQFNSPAVNPASALTSPIGGVLMMHDVVYGQGGMQALHAEIAFPRTGLKALPAIIYIHGGGWIGGSNKEAPLLQIAQAGYFAASIEYRLDNAAKWPAQIEDCQLAVRWLRAHADGYHVDPNRIGVWGASAGGHLVTCLGTMADQAQYDVGGYPGVSSAVQAVVDYYGPTDFTRVGAYTPTAIHLCEGLFGVAYEENPALWKSGSPVFFVKPGDPPMLLVHGDSDGLVPLEQSTELDQALSRAGVPHQFIIVKNADHGFAPRPGTTIAPSGNEINAAVFAFFEQYLKRP
jgi:acetyl esterase/lipase